MSRIFSKKIMRYKDLNEEIKKASECFRNGGEVIWTVDGITHYHSLKNPHDFMHFECTGQCRHKSITGKKDNNEQ